MIHDKLLKEFSDLVVKVGSASYRKIKNQEFLKMKLSLKDGSSLEVREFYDEEDLSAHSYYWLTTDKQLLVGWDNAPHHKHLKTYPAHKHVGSQDHVSESHEHNLRQVLTAIRAKLNT